jgi:hypothetical protein
MPTGENCMRKESRYTLREERPAVILQFSLKSDLGVLTMAHIPRFVASAGHVSFFIVRFRVS